MGNYRITMEMDTMIFNIYGVVAAVLVANADTGNEMLDRVATVLAIIYMIVCVFVKIKNYIKDNGVKATVEKAVEVAKDVAEKKKENEDKDKE